MKRNVTRSLALATLLVATVLVTPGCNKPSPATIKAGLHMAGKEGSLFGLRKWAEKQPDAAHECATTLKKNIDGVLIPYLNGGNLPSSAEIQAFIQSSLFNGVAPDVKDAIVLASVALDTALPIPESDTYLKPDQVDYIKEFLSGVSEGCNDFLSRDLGTPRHWIK